MKQSIQRYYLSDNEAAEALRHEGVGWGHLRGSVMLSRMARHNLFANLTIKRTIK
jgi:hypothetical protein